MNRRWFFFFFRKSVSQRRGRVLIASAGVTLAVAIVTAMVSVTVGIREKLGSELKAYGANILVSSRDDAGFDAGLLDRIAALPSAEDVNGHVLQNISVKGQVIEMIGLDINRARMMGWRMFGKWPEKSNEVIAGINLKTALGLAEGVGIRTVKEGRIRDFVISGFIEKGGAEDSAVIMSIPQAWDAAGGEGRLHLFLIRGKSGQLDQTADAVRRLMPTAMVKTVRQVAMAEENLLAKMQLLMILVTVVVIFAAAISVGSTMGANVLERREEIGLMKALGATRRAISSFYMAEAVLIGIAGGSAGFLLGFFSAQAVSKGAFNSFISMPILLPLVSLVMGVVVALISSYFPVRGAMRYDPAIILRGE